MDYSSADAAKPHNLQSRLQVDSSVNPTRVISPHRDAAFVRDLQALLAHKGSAGSGGTSVCFTPSPSTPPIALPSNAPIHTKPKRSRMLPWWEGTYSGEAGRAHRFPAQWRDTSDLLRVLYFHLAMREFGQVHSFSLNLRPDIESQARFQDSPVGWIQKRVVRHLEAALGRSVAVYVVLEEDRQRLHVHGEIQIGADEAAPARKALRKAGGEWKQVRQHQAHTGADPDQGWPSYIGKEFYKYRPWARRFYERERGASRITISGNLYSSTSEVGKAARALYEKHRRLVIRRRCGLIMQ